MKKRTRPLALLMAAAILGSTLTACGGGSDSGTNGSDSAVEGLAEDMALTDAPAEEITLPISTDGLELSFFAMPEPVITSKMKGYSEMTVHQTAEELTGVHINWREESYTDPKQKMNLMFSTGDTEDIVWDAWKHASGGPKKLLDEGLIVSLNPYIEKYAPNLKKLLQETPDCWNRFLPMTVASLCSPRFVWILSLAPIPVLPFVRTGWIAQDFLYQKPLMSGTPC